MFKYLLVVLNFFCLTIVSSQNLQKINSIEEAESFIKLNPKAEITTLEISNDSLEYYKIFSEEMSKDNNMKYFNISIRPKELLENINKEIDALNKELEVSKKKEADIKNKISRLEKEKEVFSKIDKDEVCICSLICTYTKTHAWSLYIGSDDLANFTFAVTRSYYEAIKDAYDRLTS